MLGQGTFLLADLSGAVFPKPVNGFRLKKFFGPNPIQNVVGVRHICVVGGNHLEDIKGTYSHHFGLQITKENIGHLSLRLDVHTSEREFFCNAWKINANDNFPWTQKLKLKLLSGCQSRKGWCAEVLQMKEIKEDNSYLPSDDDAQSIEEITQRSSSASAVVAASSIFTDSKVILDLTNSKNRVWLQTIGLLDFALLPWESWKCNAQAMYQFRFLQSTDGFLAPNVFLSAELISYVFNLPMERETEFEKVSVRVLEKEFGIPDNARGYYVVKRAKDPDRRVQLEWFLENVLLLIKSEYMSDKNYSYLHTVERGKRVAWAIILHEKILSEIRGKDKRKLHKTSRLGPILAAIFQRIKNLEHMFGDSFAQYIKPFVKGAKRTGDDIEDEPPQSRSKVGNQDEVVDGQKIMDDLKVAGYSKAAAEIAVTSYKRIKDPLFPDALQIKSRDQSGMSPSGSQKKGLKLIVAKNRTAMKPDSEGTEKIDSVSFMKQGIPVEVSVQEAKKAWKVMDEFLTQQQTNVQIQQRGQRELENKVVDLQRQLEQGDAKGKIVLELEERIKQLQEENEQSKQEMQSLKKKYEDRLEQRLQADLKITDWLTEMRISYAVELEELTQKNSKLLSSNEIILQQLIGLKRFRDQLRSMVSDNE